MSNSVGRVARTYPGALLLLVAGLAVTLACGGRSAPQEGRPTKAKVAFITVGPVADWGYNYSHELSRRHLEQVLGDRVETTLVENVPESADVERVMARLISEGYGLLFPTSFGYLDPALRTAARYPDATFMHCGGFKTAPNLGTYFAYLDEPFYLAGLAAGHVTSSRKLGFVAAHPIPNVLREINAFTLGARRVNPAVTVTVVWTNAWSDPAKEAEAANSLVDAGADVLAVHQDSPIAVVQAAEKRGVFAVGCHANLRQFAPNGWLTGAEWNWGAIVEASTRAYLDGTWEPSMIRGGLREGYVALSEFGAAVPPAVREEIEAARSAIMREEYAVFSGPLKDRDGRTRLEAGQRADFDLLEKMDWLVEGVKGNLPK